MSDTYDRIRERAYRIWLDEGKPEGRAEEHWDMASELVGIEENHASMLKPNPLEPGEETIDASEPIEALEVQENLGGFPTLTDQGEEQTVPKRRGRASPAAGTPPAANSTKKSSGPKRTK